MSILHVKLTKAQQELLADICESAQAVSETYRPAQELVAHGLAEWTKTRYSWLLGPTSAGLLRHQTLAKTTE